MTTPDLDGGARGCLAGGNAPALKIEIEYITIATLGDAIDFGDLQLARTGAAGCASRVRGLFCCGATSPTFNDHIDMLTFASTGSETDFGNADTTRGYRGATSDSTRGLIAG